MDLALCLAKKIADSAQMSDDGIVGSRDGRGRDPTVERERPRENGGGNPQMIGAPLQQQMFERGKIQRQAMDPLLV